MDQSSLKSWDQDAHVLISSMCSLMLGQNGLMTPDESSRGASVPCIQAGSSLSLEVRPAAVHPPPTTGDQLTVVRHSWRNECSMGVSFEAPHLTTAQADERQH